MVLSFSCLHACLYLVLSTHDMNHDSSLLGYVVIIWDMGSMWSYLAVHRTRSIYGFDFIVFLRRFSTHVPIRLYLSFMFVYVLPALGLIYFCIFARFAKLKIYDTYISYLNRQ